MRSKTGILAFLASFSVYLIPLVGPHTFSFLGEMFFHGIYRTNPLWIAADFAAAFLFQAIAFGLFFWFFRKTRAARALALLISVPVFIASAQLTFLISIPSFFLIDNDTASESGEWPVECSAEDAWISPVPMPAGSASASIPEVLIQTSKGTYGMMSVPGCAIKLLRLPQPVVRPGGRVDFMLGIDYVVPGAALLFNKQETRTGIQTWALLKRDQDDATPVEAPDRVIKILSNDGQWIGWVQPPQVVIRHIDGARREALVDLSGLGVASYTPVDIDMQAGTVTLSRNEEFVVVGLDGRIRSTISELGGVAVQPNTFRTIGDGWVAWDAYRDQDEPYRVSWSLPAGKGTHRVLKGRSINSVAVAPSADLIAISVAASLSIGNIQDAVYVLRAGDGKEVYRRYLPRYTRTQVVFSGKDLFLYSSGGKTLLVRILR